MIHENLKKELLQLPNEFSEVDSKDSDLFLINSKEELKQKIDNLWKTFAKIIEISF